jgi:fatty-acyl-CoA synthase
MASTLTRWIDQPSREHGVNLAGDSGQWIFRDYAQMASSVRGVAAELLARGVRPGDVLCVVLPTDHDCLATFFGVWAAGAVICPIAPPAMQPEADYIAHVASVLEQARPVATIAPEPLCHLIVTAMNRAQCPGLPWVIGRGPGGAELQRPGEFALLQFTSGSTGRPRGIRVSWQSLDANIAAIRHWLDWKDGEGTASWLPFYHDMGLIGCLLTTVAAQGDLWLMRPDQFVRDPRRWLTALTAGRACRTSAPPFGYGYAASRLASDNLDELDLSGVRAAVVGAEFLDASALEAFARLLDGGGFTRNAFAPAYGLAEATLLVTGAEHGEEHGEGPNLVQPDWESMTFGETVHIRRRGSLGSPSIDHPETGWLVGCGRAGRGVRIAILGNDERPLPDGHLGEIAVAGTSVATGYAVDPIDQITRFVDGELRTGDAGFIFDGELFVLGRMGDSLKVRGRAVYMERLESRVTAAVGLRRSRCAVVNATTDGRDGIALLVEDSEGDWVPRAADLLHRELTSDCGITIIVGRRGLIKRTSSGKLRRRHMWEQIRAGTAAGTVVYRSDAREPDDSAPVGAAAKNRVR